MGLTVMVRAESSQSISFSLPFSWSLMVRWCAARMRNTPRMIINTRKLTHTTMTMVAALGTTAREQTNKHKMTGQMKTCSMCTWAHSHIKTVLQLYVGRRSFHVWIALGVRLSLNSFACLPPNCSTLPHISRKGLLLFRGRLSEPDSLKDYCSWEIKGCAQTTACTDVTDSTQV